MATVPITGSETKHVQPLQRAAIGLPKDSMVDENRDPVELMAQWSD